MNIEIYYNGIIIEHDDNAEDLGNWLIKLGLKEDDEFEWTPTFAENHRFYHKKVLIIDKIKRVFVNEGNKVVTAHITYFLKSNSNKL